MIKRQRLKIYGPGLIILGLLLVWSTCARADVSDVVINLSASRDILEADGSSTAAITASVSTRSGNPVPDGTEIAFSTDRGELDPELATTQNGIARTTLLSDVKPGQATILATERSSGAEARLSIEFSNEVGRTAKGWEIIHIKGTWVEYGVDTQTAEAQGKAHFDFNGLAVTAKSLFFDLDGGILKARGEVTVTSNAKEARQWDGQVLWLDVFARQGAIITSEKHLTTKGFRGASLEEVPNYAPPSEAFMPFGAYENRLDIVCKRLLIYPREKVMCERAKIYMDGQKMLSLPYYFVPLSFSADVLNPKVGISSSGGLEVDLPFFYAVSEKRVGAVRLVRGSLGEWSGGTGWTLGVEEQYAPNPQNKIVFDYDDITRNDWGLRLKGTFKEDSGRHTYVNLGYPRHDYFYFSGTSYKYADGNSTSLNSFISRQKGDANYDVNARWRIQRDSKPFDGIKGLRWRRNLDLLFDNQGASPDRTATELGVDLTHQGWSLGSGLRLTPRMRLGRGLAVNGDTSDTFVFNLELNERFARRSYASLRYSYTDTDRFGSSYPYNENMLLNLRWYPSNKFSTYLSSRYDLHSDDYTIDSHQSYQISDSWSLLLYQVKQERQTYSYTDYEINLRKRLTNGALAMLRWSKARDQVWFEFATTATLF